MNRQYCASCYCIDFNEAMVLLMYNKKLNKWLQPGGHIDNEKLELPYEAAIREVYEETGVKIKIIGPSYDGGNIEPIAVAHYKNKVGDMIDIQYLAIPLTKTLNNFENNKVVWYKIRDLENSIDVEDEIKVKVKKLYHSYKDKKL